MMHSTVSQRRAALREVERRLAEVNTDLLHLEKERSTLQQQVQDLRRSLTMCPKCGRAKDFLADEGGVLIHVLEEPDDTDLLVPGKPLFCPACGDVFLYNGPAPPVVVATPRRR